MIYIKKIKDGENSISFCLDGVIDEESIATVEDVCHPHIGRKEIILDLEGISHITREGREFLRKLQNNITILNLPAFINLNTKK